MDTWDKFFILLFCSLSIFPLLLMMIGIYFFNQNMLAIIGMTFIPLIPTWIICIYRMQDAQNTIYDMNIKKQMQNDLERLGIQ